MKRSLWPTRDPVKDYFPLPKEIFSLGLSATEIAIYAYLLFCEDRQTFQCWPSYRKIGEAVGLSPNTSGRSKNAVCSSQSRRWSQRKMGKRATAICDLPSDQFRRHSSRTITDRCRNWTRMRQDENMPILLKTQVESADKTPVTVCRARVGGLCRFRRPAERVPAGSPKTGRCTAVRERCGNGKRRRRTPPGGFQQREKSQAAKQEKGLTLFCVWPSTSARSAGSFGG